MVERLLFPSADLDPTSPLSVRASDAAIAALEIVDVVKFNGWTATAQAVTISLAGVEMEEGDILCQFAFYGSSGGGPPVTGADTVPSGFTKKNYFAARGTALGVYWRTIPAGGLASFVTRGYTNVNYKGLAYVLRNADPTNPVLVATSAENFNAANPYPSATAPVGRTAIAFTARPLANNAATNNQVAPKPSNWNDARTDYEPPAGSEQYVNWSLYKRLLLPEEEGQLIAPGAVGGNSQWCTIHFVMLQGVEY